MIFTTIKKLAKYAHMPNPRKSLTGKRFGKLLVLSRVGQVKPGGISIWLCRCDCGTEKELLYNHLTSLKTKSCGCLRKKKPK